MFIKKESGLCAQQLGNSFGNYIEGKSVIASEAWQSRGEKFYYYGNGDIFL